MPYHTLYEKSEITLYQIISTIKAWILMIPVNGGGIENPRYIPLNHAVVSSFIAVIFFIGLFFAIYKFRQTYIWIFIYVVGLVFGQILTVDPPNGSRGLILLPVIYLFSSFGLFFLYKKFEKYKLTKPLFILVAILIAVWDFYIYTNWMSWIQV